MPLDGDLPGEGMGSEAAAGGVGEVEVIRALKVGRGLGEVEGFGWRGDGGQAGEVGEAFAVGGWGEEVVDRVAGEPGAVGVGGATIDVGEPVACEPGDPGRALVGRLWEAIVVLVRVEGAAQAELAQQSLAGMVAHNRRSAKTHSGIWRDLAVRKRKTEAEAQLGAIVAAGQRAGVPTPITARLLELIGQIEQGQRVQGRENLDRLSEVIP